MQSVGGQGATSGVQMLASPSTQASAEDDASPAESSAVPKGSGSLDDRDESTRSPLPPTAAQYADSYGWPIFIEGDAVTVQCCDVVDVTTMPTKLADEVNKLLRLQFMKAPILELTVGTIYKSSTWAFFSQPKLPTHNDQRMAKLSGCEVEHFGAGAKFPLPPSPTCGGDGLTWRVPPPFGELTIPLPPWESIASCALKIKYRSTGH